MKKVYLSVFAVMTLLSFLFILSHWKLKAQEAKLETTTMQVETEEFAPDLEQETDLEFVQAMEFLGDSELLEMLISDPDFLEVLEEFGEDIGIEEEEVPYDLLEENEVFSELMSEIGKPEKVLAGRQK